MSYKQKLVAYLEAIGSNKSGVTNPDGRDNLGTTLCDIFTWHEVKAFAEDRLKRAWANAQGKDGLFSDDDLLREELAKGEHILAESNSFSCIVKVENPRLLFDEDLYIKCVAKKFKISEAKLRDMATECFKQSKPVLKKRVLEAA